jgi:hypothetical protein
MLGVMDSMNLAAATASFTVCSMGMMVFNKLAVRALPLACGLVVLQMAFTVLVMVTCFWKTIHIGSLKDVMRWSAVIPFFVCMLLTSMFALKDAPMSLIITFRAASPWLTLTVERFFPNPTRVGMHSMMAMLVMLIFVCMYGRDLERKDENTRWAIGWVAMNSLMAVAERLLQRLMLSKDQAPVDISKTGVSLLNNLIGMVPILAVAVWLGEPGKAQEVYAAMSNLDKVWVFLSCVAGVGISYTAIWAQSLISATSMLVLTNSNKFVVILLEIFAMPESRKLTPLQIVGAFGAIAASVAYSKARDFEIAQEKAKSIDEAQKGETEPLIAKKV